MTRAGLSVKKFGGSSVGSVALLIQVARRLAEAHRQGVPQLVVVSAMGRCTDNLLELARQVSDRPPGRETDLLLATGEQASVALLGMALGRLGVPAVSLTGWQCGIITDGFHRNARVREVDTARIARHLREGRIVVAAGFQGISREGEVTTLGRGGSDVSAVVLAAALGAGRCEIYTDVEGVFTADPRLVPEAVLIRRIAYDPMIEFAASGGRVLHPRCVELARQFGIELLVRSSFGSGPGTTILKEHELEGKTTIKGVAVHPRVAKIDLLLASGNDSRAPEILERIGKLGLMVRSLQSRDAGEGLGMQVLVCGEELELSLESLRTGLEDIRIRVDHDLAEVSLVGCGLGSLRGIVSRILELLREARIPLFNLVCSEMRISITVPGKRAGETARVLHAGFELSRDDSLRQLDSGTSDAGRRGLKPASPVGLNGQRGRSASRPG